MSKAVVGDVVVFKHQLSKPIKGRTPYREYIGVVYYKEDNDHLIIVVTNPEDLDFETFRTKDIIYVVKNPKVKHLTFMALLQELSVSMVK